MNEERLLNILQAPHVSEKSTYSMGGYRQYIFKVAPDANKFEIKKAVEHIFNVNVHSVRVCNMKSKPSRFGQIKGRRKAWKKAYVALEEGQELEVST